MNDPTQQDQAATALVWTPPYPLGGINNAVLVLELGHWLLAA